MEDSEMFDDPLKGEEGKNTAMYYLKRKDFNGCVRI